MAHDPGPHGITVNTWNYPLPAGIAPRILSARSFILWTP